MKVFTFALVLAVASNIPNLHVAQAWSPSLSVTTKRNIHTNHLKNITPLQAVAVPLGNVVDYPADTLSTTGADSTILDKQLNQPLKLELAPHDEWIANLDFQGFGRDVAKLGKELLQETGPDDVRHLHKISHWRNLAAIIGVVTLCTTPNPITMAALSTWTYASWTMIAHHTCHGGYNRVSTNNSAATTKSKYHSRGFAIGTLKRRVMDWLDWMQPEAWNVEHNRLHHYRLNEIEDPDLVQRNLEFVRNDHKLPTWLKYAKVFAFMPIWKWYYYAPNTFKELQLAKYRTNHGATAIPNEIDAAAALTVRALLKPENESERQLLKIVKPKAFFSGVVAPFFVTRFVLLPLAVTAVLGAASTVSGGSNLLLPLRGLSTSMLFRNAMLNLVAAELLTNIHAFITIVTNHAGEDLYTFGDAVKPKTPSFYVRQIVGSANYKTGSDANDFGHGFLNYQIEHHVWPDLSMLQYQRGAPRLKAICESHGVPYIQESVWERTRKTLRIMVGSATMRPFPTEYEPARDKALQGVTWKSTNGAIDDDDEETK